MDQSNIELRPAPHRDGREVWSEPGRAVGEQQAFRAKVPFDVGNDEPLAPDSEMGPRAKLAHRRGVGSDDLILKIATEGGSGLTAITNEERRMERRKNEPSRTVERKLLVETTNPQSPTTMKRNPD